MSRTSSRPAYASSSRENGKTGTQQHNRDKLGSKSGPMGKEDQRKDKYGSRHNQDAQGLQSEETAEVRNEMGAARSRLSHKKRSRTGSR